MAFQSSDPLNLNKKIKINKFVGDEIWMHLIIDKQIVWPKVHPEDFALRYQEDAQAAIIEFCKAYEFEKEWTKRTNYKGYAYYHHLKINKIGFNVHKGNQSSTKLKFELAKDLHKFYCNLLKSSVKQSNV